MNAHNRKELAEANSKIEAVKALLEEAKDIISGVADEAFNQVEEVVSK